MWQVLQAKEKIENQTRIEKYMMLVEKGYVLYYTHQCPINAKYVPVVEESAAKNGIPFKHNHWVFCTYDTRNQLGTHFLPCP